MLEPIKHSLEFKRIILASVSARRSEILRSIASISWTGLCLGISGVAYLYLLIYSILEVACLMLHPEGLRFEIMPSLFPENLDVKNFPNLADYAVETAYRKVLDVADRVKEDLNQPDIIIGADTVVTLDGKIYGKPKDSRTAQQYLEDLSGRQHTVHTGVVIKTPNATVKFHETALVTMAFLTEETINGYVRSREPLDKAGAYGIQGLGGSLIEKINGDYYTVVGLPLHSFCKHLLWILDDRKKKMELEMSTVTGKDSVDQVKNKFQAQISTKVKNFKTIFDNKSDTWKIEDNVTYANPETIFQPLENLSLLKIENP